MNDDQILLITEKLATFGTKVDNLADIVKEMKRELATKAELAALEKRVVDLEMKHQAHVDGHKDAPYKKWMLIGTVMSGLAGVAAIVSLVIAYHK